VALLVESMPLTVQVKVRVKFAITKSGPRIIGVASCNNSILIRIVQELCEHFHIIQT
jgi:glyceraldehyde-3-phosphate dehydrogenase/erythrose-4-phosphate dehydrogenase